MLFWAQKKNLNRKGKLLIFNEILNCFLIK